MVSGQWSLISSSLSEAHLSRRGGAFSSAFSASELYDNGRGACAAAVIFNLALSQLSNSNRTDFEFG